MSRSGSHPNPNPNPSYKSRWFDSVRFNDKVDEIEMQLEILDTQVDDLEKNMGHNCAYGAIRHRLYESAKLCDNLYDDDLPPSNANIADYLNGKGTTNNFLINLTPEEAHDKYWKNEKEGVTTRSQTRSNKSN